jgi:hypothetical protein
MANHAYRWQFVLQRRFVRNGINPISKATDDNNLLCSKIGYQFFGERFSIVCIASGANDGNKFRGI